MDGGLVPQRYPICPHKDETCIGICRGPAWAYSAKQIKLTSTTAATWISYYTVNPALNYIETRTIELNWIYNTLKPIWLLFRNSKISQKKDCLKFGLLTPHAQPLSKSGNTSSSPLRKISCIAIISTIEHVETLRSYSEIFLFFPRYVAVLRTQQW